LTGPSECVEITDLVLLSNTKTMFATPSLICLEVGSRRIDPSRLREHDTAANTGIKEGKTGGVDAGGNHPSVILQLLHNTCK